MRYFLLSFLLGLSALYSPAQWHPREDWQVEPGLFVIPQKAWFFGNNTTEALGYAGGINLGLRKGDRHGIQFSPTFSIQQGVRIHQPCEDLINPCPALTTKAWYVKLPVMYRYTLLMNESVLIKALAGPQMSVCVGPSTYKSYYSFLTVDAVCGIELCHQLSNNLFLNYGLRWDVSLTHPVKESVLTPFNEPILKAESPNRNMTAGLVIGVDYLLERKYHDRMRLKPGSHARGR